jgi:Flp pilus assembly pilin Flp
MLRRFAGSVRTLLLREDPGQGMIEYALIVALVAVVAIAGIIILGPSIMNLIGSISSSV